MKKKILAALILLTVSCVCTFAQSSLSGKYYIVTLGGIDLSGEKNFLNLVEASQTINFNTDDTISISNTATVNGVFSSEIWNYDYSYNAKKNIVTISSFNYYYASDGQVEYDGSTVNKDTRNRYIGSWKLSLFTVPVCDAYNYEHLIMINTDSYDSLEGYSVDFLF